MTELVSKSDNVRNIIMRLFRKPWDAFIGQRKLWENDRWEMSSSNYTSVRPVPDFLGVVSFTSPLTSTSCKRGISHRWSTSQIRSACLHFITLALLVQLLSSPPCTSLFTGGGKSWTIARPWRKLKKKLYHSLCIGSLCINHEKLTGPNMLFLPYSLRENKAHLAFTQSQVAVMQLTNMIWFCFYRVIGGSQDRGGQGDSRVQESKEKGWVINLSNTEYSLRHTTKAQMKSIKEPQCSLLFETLHWAKRTLGRPTLNIWFIWFKVNGGKEGLHHVL